MKKSDEIIEYKKLFDEGIITEEEYQIKKNKICGLKSGEKTFSDTMIQRADKKKKITIIVFVAIAMLAVVLCICQHVCHTNNSATVETDMVSDEIIQNIGNENESEEISFNTAYEAYAHILKSYEKNIQTLVNLNQSNQTVSLYDINNDGVEELFLLKQNMDQGECYDPWLTIYSYIDGTIVEIPCRQEKKLNKYQFPHHNNPWFDALFVGGEKNAWFMILLLDNGEIAVIDEEVSNLIMYGLDIYVMDNNEFKLVKVVRNEVHPAEEPAVDLYYINGQKVSSKAGMSEFGYLKEHFKKAILYNGEFRDFSVYKKINDKNTLSMTYEEALDHLTADH